MEERGDGCAVVLPAELQDDGVVRAVPGFVDEDDPVVVPGHFEKDEIMIVGDSLTSDMKGGDAAGIVTCYYNPRRLPHGDEVRIDCEIASIPEVLSLPGIEAAVKGALK